MNDWLATMRDIWDGIRSQPGRIGLSFLAIAIGIASLTVLIGMLNGLRDKSRLMVQELGANVIAVLRQGDDKANRNGRAQCLQEKHLKFLRANFPDSPVAGVRRYSVPTPGTDQRLTVVATDESLLRVRQWRMHTGRFFDANDLRHAERHAVISRRLSESWNWGIGDVILLRSTPFRIIGIIEVGGSAVELELGDPGLMLGERVIFVPRTVRPDWEEENYQATSQILDGIFMQVSDRRQFDRTVAQVQRLMAQPDCRPDSVSWITPESLIRSVRRLQLTIQLTLGGISLLCLVLGGTTMMSLMVANVRYRVAEIGLRRTLGAKARDIVILFVAEAGIVTLLAGLTGIVVTHVLLLMARDLLSVPVKLDWASAVIPLIVALILGAAFSYWPAKAAAAIAPSEALRND